MTLTCPHCGKSGQRGGMRTHIRYIHETDHAAKFWSKVKKTDGCWLFQGALNTTGYGMVSWAGKKNIVAHRLAYELLRGPIPAGMLALHKCDTPACVNPDHMFFGTDAENKADCVAKDRHCRGARNGHAVLTDAQAREILSKFTGRWGENLQLAKEYGVTPTCICALKKGRTWKHLPRST